MNINKQKKAFTLIELMVVMVILGLLATIIMPKILDRPEKARRLKAMIQIKNFQNALAQMMTDTGNFPNTSQGLQALVEDPGMKGYQSGGYIDKIPLDPWSTPYIYICPGTHGDYDIKSYGKDGESGGDKKNADIESWNLDGE